ncbi:MAG: radical SAM protein [Acidobacteria bacterium]|nr:radical SAM protein [Acidobacteriota bacterium]
MRPLRSRYYLPDPGRSPLRRLALRLTGRPVPAFPRTVQIQTVTGCNADCTVCAYGPTAPRQPRGRMPEELFRALVDECSSHRVRRISPYLMNEPLLDPDLPERIGYIKTRSPRSKVVITTNGSLLGAGVVDRLLALEPGLDALYVSFQGIDPEVYRRTMRGAMRMSVTLENVDRLILRQRERRRRRPEIRITMVRTGRLDWKRALRYWRRRGVRCQVTALENLGGNRPDSSLHPAGVLEPNTTCRRLFRQAYILFNGDMVLCCADWRRQVILGNVAERSIREVWNGERALGIRRAYLEGRFSDLILCRDCRIDRVHPLTFPGTGGRGARPG